MAFRHLSANFSPHLSRHVAHSGSVLQRSFSTNSHTLYHNPRRLRSAGMTVLALGQAGFWAAATAMSQQVDTPLIGTEWTFVGFGLSAAFGALITTYLRRSVAEIALVESHGGPAVRVTPHAPAGFLGRTEIIPARELVGGPKRAQDDRYWTFTRGGGRLFYVVDVSAGVVDREGLKAVVGGGEHLLALAHKRDAGRMRKRWDEWKERR